MSYLGRNTFKVGNVVYPLPTGTGHDAILDMDPCLANVLLFFSTVIHTYEGASFAERATQAGLTDPAGIAITSPILQLAPSAAIVNFLETQQFKFPILAMDRIKSTFEEGPGREWFQRTSEVQLLYILPPMTVSQFFIMGSFRKSISDIVLDRMMLGFDSSWNNNAVLWKIAGLEKLSLINERYVELERKEDIKTFFPMLIMDFKMVERKNMVPNSFPPLTQIDGQVDVSDGYQPNNFNLIDFKLNLP